MSRPGRASRAPTQDEIRGAHELVRAHLPITPIVRAPGLGARTFLKVETVLPTGSFKVRGGVVAVASGDTSEPVIAASAGNHGLGVAWAAARAGIDATVVVPETASPVKIAALDALGVEVVRHGESYDDAEAFALDLAATGAGRFVSPYNDPATIAGQSTIATELVEQLPELAGVVVPIGGGGLVAGVALGLEAAGRSDIEVVGVEAAASPAVSAAARARGPAPWIDVQPTLADGLAGNLEPGSVTVDIAREHVGSFVAVDEDEIAEAIRWLATDAGFVAEGSAAVGVAALLAGYAEPERDGDTVVVITGRNIAPATLAAVLLD